MSDPRDGGGAGGGPHGGGRPPHGRPAGGRTERDARRERRRRARKERVLHTRISDDLAEDIRRIAEDLRVPVSNIVRTVLEEAFSAVERVTDDVGDLIEEVVDEAQAARERIRRRQWARRASRGRSGFAEDLDEAWEAPVEDGAARGDEVIGWQPLLLAGARRCDVCGAPLPAGSQAWAAVTARGIGGAVRCERCVREHPGAA